MDEIVTNVYATTDYGKFKRMVANRMTIPRVIKALVSSMQKYGWCGAPIVCNERMEIVDGQHRVEAAEEANVPVHYIVIDGLTIDACIELNRNHKDWATVDYIYSFAERGNPHYKLVSQMLAEYGGKGKLLQNVVLTVCCGNMQSVDSLKIQNGEFTFKDPEKARRILEFLTCFDISKIKGAKACVHYALNGIYDIDDIDNSRMIKQFERYGGEIKRVTDTRDAVEQLEAIYNKRQHNIIYLLDKYRALANYRCGAIPGGKKENA